MQKELTEEKANTVDIKHFISLIRKCKEPTEISDLMFAELIDKIVVYEAEGVGKARTQKVDIYFNYVGQVDIAYTEEELAEIKAQEEQIEMERLAKQREREKAYREKRKAKKLAENGGEIVKAKVCPHCQKEFVPTSNRQIFCSKDCCYQARQDKTKADREAEKGNHYYRQRVCAVCGSTYWPTHSQQKFCSEECQKQNHNEKSLEFYHKKQKEKSGCNDDLGPDVDGHATRCVGNGVHAVVDDKFVRAEALGVVDVALRLLSDLRHGPHGLHRILARG